MTLLAARRDPLAVHHRLTTLAYAVAVRPERLTPAGWRRLAAVVAWSWLAETVALAVAGAWWPALHLLLAAVLVAAGWWVRALTARAWWSR